MRRYLVAGNWKMTQTRESAVALARGVALAARGVGSKVEVVLAPAFPHLIPVVEALAGTSVSVAAQNVYFEKPGASPEKSRSTCYSTVVADRSSWGTASDVTCWGKPMH